MCEREREKEKLHRKVGSLVNVRLLYSSLEENDETEFVKSSPSPFLGTNRWLKCVMIFLA